MPINNVHLVLITNNIYNKLTNTDNIFFPLKSYNLLVLVTLKFIH